MTIPSNYTGDGKYLELWEKYRSAITNYIKIGGNSIRLNHDEFAATGNRQDYSFKLTIIDGDIPTLAGSAVARDLKAILDGSPSFKKYATGKTVIISLSRDFNLDVYVQ